MLFEGALLILQWSYLHCDCVDSEEAQSIWTESQCFAYVFVYTLLCASQTAQTMLDPRGSPPGAPTFIYITPRAKHFENYINHSVTAKLLGQFNWLKLSQLIWYNGIHTVQ